MSNILMIVTAAMTLTLKDRSEHPTGFWAEELTVTHRELVGAGHAVTIATPGGISPTVDPGSLSPEIVGIQATVDELTAYLASIADELAAAVPVETVNPSDYAAVALPGGHGPMTDLAFDSNVGRLLVAANAAGTIIAPFCHGPAALPAAELADGTNAFAGRRPPSSPTRRNSPAAPAKTRPGGSKRRSVKPAQLSTPPHRGATTSSSMATSSPARTRSQVGRSHAECSKRSTGRQRPRSHTKCGAGSG